MSQIKLPDALVNTVRSGDVVLLLGAGATMEAGGPSGQGLANQLAEKFLPVKYKGKPLEMVAEYAISQHDLVTVQQYVEGCFSALKPSEAHTILPTFRWKAIITTNYDTLIEETYRLHPTGVQHVVPFIRDQDRIYERLSDKEALPLIKLHGCITVLSDPDLPLILSTEQYVNYQINRRRLFSQFKDICCEKTVLIVGYSLADQNVRAILKEIDAEIKSRPRYYLVQKDADDVVAGYWGSRRVTVIPASFGELMKALDEDISPHLRGHLKPPETGNPAIAKRIVRRSQSMSRNTIAFLDQDADIVDSITAVERVDPIQFYKGADAGWAGIEQGLDVKRKLMDQILCDYWITEPESKFSLVVIKAHAGAGKTVLLRRLAWQSGKEFDKLTLFIKADGVINAAALVELSELTDETLFVFVDNIVSRRAEVISLFGQLASFPGKLVIVTTARTNEWNNAPSTLTSLATDLMDLEYLTPKEIDELLQLLETNKALGSLERLNPEERKEQLAEKAGRQILVALHEATHGKRFEEIILDEYNNISPDLAQRIYLSICFLNRFGVFVRAGIISRMHGVAFDEFRQKFFAPLEQVVLTKQDHKDNYYCSRHSHIAEMLVQQVLNTQEVLFNEMITSLRLLNPNYSPDRIAWRRLLAPGLY